MATATSIDYVQKMFIAYLGRGASTEALTYWADQIDASGDAAKDALFYDLYSSAEGTALYDGKTQDQIINAVFQNAFERDAKEAGLTFYKAELDAGNLNLVSMAGAIVDSADTAGAATFDLKNQAAEYYRTQVDATDGKAFLPAESKAAVDPVDGPNSLQASKDATDQAISGVGVSTTLTTAADTITLTGGADTITGVVGTGATYNSEDANDASTTDNDTLTLSGDSQFNFNHVNNIENVNVSLADDALAAITIDADKLIGGDVSMTVAKTVTVLGAQVAGQTAVVLQNFGSDSLSTTNATNVNVATGNKAMAQTFTLDSAAATVAIGNVEANDTTITLANNDATLSLTGTAATNDSVTIAADNEVALTHTAGATAVENVSLSGTNGALEVTVTGITAGAATSGLQKYTVTGDNDVKLIAAGDQIDSSTLTNSGTGDVSLEITAADVGNLEGFGVLGGGIELSTAAGTHTYTLASGNTVTSSVDANVLSFDANDTATTSTLTLNLDNDTNGITTAKFETVTINGAATNALTTGALSLAGADATITSANDVSLTTLDGYSSITVTGDSVTSTGNIGGTTEGNDITITSTNETVIGGTLDTVDTGNFGDVKVTAGTTFTLNGAATVEDLTVIADGVDINAGVTAANDITMTTTNDIDYGAQTITATTGNIDLTAAKFTGSGAITATAGNIIIDGTNDADAAGTLGNLVATAGDIQLESGDLNFGASVITSGDTVKIIGDAEVSITGDLTATTGVMISSTNDVSLGAVNAPVLSGAGASGVITASFDAGASASVTANTGSGNDTLTLDKLTTVFTVDTGADNDTINVTRVKAASTIAGNAGIDTFDIAATATELATYNGGDGNDVFEIASAAVKATVVGGDGTDSLTLETNGVSYKDVLGFTGIEKLNVVGNTTALDAVDLAGNDSTFEIAGGDLTVANAGNANVTLSLAGVTAKADNGVTEEVNYTAGTGADIITGSTTMVNNLTAAANGGTNSFTGGNFVDVLTGGAGADTLTGGLGNDILTGNGGNDQFTVDAGTDVIADLATGDIVDVAAGAGATIATAGFVATADTQNLGSTASDFAITAAANATVDMTLMTVSNATTDGVSLTGDAGGAETLKGSAGADILNGLAGADILTGNGGNDTFTIAGAGANVITDLSSGDIVTIAAGAAAEATGVTAFVATAGTNNIGSAAGDFGINSSDAGSTVNMTLAQAGNGYELNGGDGVDILTGSAGADTINGGANADTITGGLLIDTINGGDGADIINGGDGADIIDGGADADVITGGAGNDIITGGTGNDQFTIDAGTDTIVDLATGDIFDVAAGASMATAATGAGTATTAFVATADSQNLGGGAANAEIIAAAAGATINVSAMTVSAAATGGVTITGGAGADIITGSAGNDIIVAGGGADAITGGLGLDAIALGGAGQIDTIKMTTGGAIAVDTVSGFIVALGEDEIEIDLSDINALLTGTLQLSDGSAASAASASGAGTVTIAASAAHDFGASAAKLTTITGATAYTEASLETALEGSATSGGMTAGEGFLIAYDNTANTYIAYVTVNADTADGVLFTDVTVTNILELTGVGAAETLLKTSLAIVA